MTQPPATAESGSHQDTGQTLNAEQLLADSEMEQFHACILRDRWLSADTGGEALRMLAGGWHCERSSSQMHKRGPGAREALQVHCRGSLCVAVVRGSHYALPGDILWQCDALERTISAFGVPGFRASLGSGECVMLVEETSKHTILYFYNGRTCLLRCWRNNSGADSDSEASEGRASKGARDASRTTGSKRSARATRGKRTKGGAVEKSEPATGDTSSDVAKWATGKDLAALISTLGHFAHALGQETPALPDANLLRGHPAALRKAYHKACLLLHPDRHVNSPAGVQALALALFQGLSEAFVASEARAAEDFEC